MPPPQIYVQVQSIQSIEVMWGIGSDRHRFEALLELSHAESDKASCLERGLPDLHELEVSGGGVVTGRVEGHTRLMGHGINVARPRVENDEIAGVHHARRSASSADKLEAAGVCERLRHGLELALSADGHHAAVVGTESDVIAESDDTLTVERRHENEVVPGADTRVGHGEPAVVVADHVLLDKVHELDDIAVVDTVRHLEASLLAWERDDELLDGAGMLGEGGGAVRLDGEVAELGLEHDDVIELHRARATKELEGGLSGDDVGAAHDLAGITNHEVLAVRAHEDDGIAVVDRPLLALRGNER